MDNKEDLNSATPNTANPDAQPAASSQPVQAAGIFSSPELTVDSANTPAELGGSQATTQPEPPMSSEPQPAQPATPAVHDNERIAAVFGRHLSSNRPQFSAPAENVLGGGARLYSDNSTNSVATPASPNSSSPVNAPAAFSPNFNSTPVTEDIQLSVPKEHHKTPLIIAILILLAAGTVVALFLTGVIGPKPTKETPLAAFEEYMDLIKNGPQLDAESNNSQPETSDDSEDTIGEEVADDMVNVNDDEWFLFRAENNGLSTEQQKAYFETVRNSYQKYLNTIAGSADKKLIEEGNKYLENLEVLIKAENLPDLSRTLAEKYIDESPGAAKEYIHSTVNIQSDITQVNSILLNLSIYLEAQLNLLEIYSEAGCLSESEIDWFCNEDINKSATTIEIIDKRNSASNSIKSNSALLQAIIMNKTEATIAWLEEQNT